MPTIAELLPKEQKDMLNSIKQQNKGLNRIKNKFKVKKNDSNHQLGRRT